MRFQELALTINSQFKDREEVLELSDKIKDLELISKFRVESFSKSIFYVFTTRLTEEDLDSFKEIYKNSVDMFKPYIRIEEVNKNISKLPYLYSFLNKKCNLN